jgi:hypothetical protein
MNWLDKIKLFFTDHGWVKWVGVISILAIALGITGYDTVVIAGEADRTAQAVDVGVTQAQSDRDTWWQGVLENTITPIKNTADSALTTATAANASVEAYHSEFLKFKDDQGLFNDMVTGKFTGYDTSIDELKVLSQISSPEFSVSVLSGMVLNAGESTMDGVIEVTIKNPISMDFKNIKMFLTLGADSDFQGPVGVTIVCSSSLPGISTNLFHLAGSTSRFIHFLSDIYTSKAHTTNTITLSIHMVFSTHATHTISFTPTLGLY